MYPNIYFFLNHQLGRLKAKLVEEKKFFTKLYLTLTITPNKVIIIEKKFQFFLPSLLFSSSFSIKHNNVSDVVKVIKNISEKKNFIINAKI